MSIFTQTRKIICENSYGYKLEFGYSFPFFLESYSGVHDYSGSVSTIKSAFGVGVSYLGTSINSREIDLTITYKDDELMQNKRTQIQNIFPQKDKGTFYFYEGNIERKINYYVESVTPVRKDGVVRNSIVLICPSPYFMDTDETITTLNNWDKLFKFSLVIPDSVGIEFGSKNQNATIEIVNNSHISYGLTIIFTSNGKVINPSLINRANNDIIKINYILNTNEQIIVTTYNDDKNIVYRDTNGNETNINNRLVFGTKFIQALNGVNRYIANADSGLSDLDCQISYYNYYEAV